MHLALFLANYTPLFDIFSSQRGTERFAESLYSLEDELHGFAIIIEEEGRTKEEGGVRRGEGGEAPMISLSTILFRNRFEGKEG